MIQFFRNFSVRSRQSEPIGPIELFWARERGGRVFYRLKIKIPVFADEKAKDDLGILETSLLYHNEKLVC